MGEIKPFFALLLSHFVPSVLWETSCGVDVVFRDVILPNGWGIKELIYRSIKVVEKLRLIDSPTRARFGCLAEFVQVLGCKF